MKPVCIFDFGNVLIRFDPKIMTEAYLPTSVESTMLQHIIFDRLYWNRLDDGSIEDDEVKARICERIPARLHEVACCIYDHWYEHLPEIEGMRQILHDLKAAGKKLYLLSNISVGFEENYARVPALHSLLSLFDGCVFSGSLGVVKPSAEIFDHLLTKYGLQPDDCVFIDDSEINVNGAKQVGIDAILFDGDARALRARLFDEV